MAVFELPFNLIDVADHECDHESCELVQQLPTALREVALENSFLLRYVHTLPVAEIGMPLYHEELEKNEGDEEKPNIIYKAHAGGTFIHVYADPGASATGTSRSNHRLNTRSSLRSWPTSKKV